MCSIRYQLPNMRRNRNIVFSKMSRRTRRFRYYPLVTNQILGFSTEVVDLIRFLEILQQHIAVVVIFELLNYLSNFFFSICLNLFNSGMWNAKDSKINTILTGTGFPVLMNFFLTIMGLSRFWNIFILLNVLEVRHKCHSW